MTTNNQQPKVGVTQTDGTVYAGELEGKKIYAAPADVPLKLIFLKAQDYAEKMNRENYLGHNDWHVPTKEELDVLRRNKDQGSLSGTFNMKTRRGDGWYTSSTWGPGWSRAWAQRFKSGKQSLYGVLCPSSVRLVRSVRP